jgi:hypothetical protein
MVLSVATMATAAMVRGLTPATAAKTRLSGACEPASWATGTAVTAMAVTAIYRMVVMSRVSAMARGMSRCGALTSSIRKMT